tara:strand:+ start:10405 stop:10629 length:225 start_codon:yes stop_codon:yes gene_type:complete
MEVCDGALVKVIGRFVDVTTHRYYHYALGSTLSELPDISWKYVLKEKSEDMIHVLQFPYNGEPPRVSMRSQKLT